MGACNRDGMWVRVTWGANALEMQQCVDACDWGWKRRGLVWAGGCRVCRAKWMCDSGVSDDAWVRIRLPLACLWVSSVCYLLAFEKAV